MNQQFTCGHMSDVEFTRKGSIKFLGKNVCPQCQHAQDVGYQKGWTDGAFLSANRPRKMRTDGLTRRESYWAELTRAMYYGDRTLQYGYVHGSNRRLITNSQSISRGFERMHPSEENSARFWLRVYYRVQGERDFNIREVVDQLQKELHPTPKYEYQGSANYWADVVANRERKQKAKARRSARVAVAV